MTERKGRFIDNIKLAKYKLSDYFQKYEFA